MSIIKICGLSDDRSLDAALMAGADMVGFVFFERSPRHVSLEQATALGVRAAGRARKVALVVDADDAALAAIIEALSPDLLQMHGSEPPERVASIRARFGVPVMRAISLASARDLVDIPRFAAVADLLLFDAKPPALSARPGGNGEAFDWSLLRGIDVAKPWLLAGGLHADNLEVAAKASMARGFDVSSGVESRPGVKDPDKITRFVAQARRLGETLGPSSSIG